MTKDRRQRPPNRFCGFPMRRAVALSVPQVFVFRCHGFRPELKTGVRNTGFNAPEFILHVTAGALPGGLSAAQFPP